jgi:uncharacterized protein (TIGR03663 family)
VKDEKDISIPENTDVQLSGSTDWLWWVSVAGITAIAAWLRFVALTLKPLHHDEGVNGFFLTDLFRKGEYHYDPANYHGPTLYYIALVFSKVFGNELNTTTIRASVAVWGVLIVALCFYLRPYIGKTGSLFTGLFVAVSPGMVFISRYFIHEIFFVFLSLSVVIAIAFFMENRKTGVVAIFWMALILLTCFLPSTLALAGRIAGDNMSALWAMRVLFFVAESALVFFVIRALMTWNDGRPVYFLLAAACVALLFATKETAFITLGTMIIACACVAIWQRIHKPSKESPDDEINDAELNWKNFVRSMGTSTDRLLILASAAALTAYLIILFFSSFFTNPDGLKGFYDAYTIWSKTGSKDHTQNGMWAYFRWGMQIEGPLFILSAVGFVIALWKSRHRFAIFAGFWAFGLLAAYTLIPYKTPWLALSFLLPMCTVAGYGIGQITASKDNGFKYLGVFLGIAAAAIMAYQTYDLNFVRYDDDHMPYVYAHTRREFLDMIRDIDHYAEASGKGKDVQIDIVSPDYWPMVWYTRDYTHANYWGKMVDVTDGDIIVAKKGEQDAEVMRRFAARYEYVGSYDLRPGVELMLLVRRDIAGPSGEELYRIPSERK